MIVQSEVRISLQALVQNYRFFCGKYHSQTLVPVIKSDAYGHDSGRAAMALASAGAEYLAVFNLKEAVEVRQAGYRGNLWLLEGVLPEDVPEAAGLDLTLACWNRESLHAMADYAAAHGTEFQIHLKMDTGMSRLGFFREELPEILAEIGAMPGIRLTGAFSHLACASQPEHPVTKFQLEEFRKIRAMLPEGCTQIHLCATDGLTFGLAPELPFGRLGIGLYGYGSENPADLHPALEFVSRIISLKTVPAGHCVSYNALRKLEKDTRLAVVPVGYADGYFRCLGNRNDVLIRGRRCPIFGNVCMGMMMADVSGVPDVRTGDMVTLLGRQGGEMISAEELAASAGTISYELLCSLGKNPVRIVE